MISPEDFSDESLKILEEIQTFVAQQQEKIVRELQGTETEMLIEQRFKFYMFTAGLNNIARLMTQNCIESDPEARRIVGQLEELIDSCTSTVSVQTTNVDELKDLFNKKGGEK